jgi:hypothetical protein
MNPIIAALQPLIDDLAEGRLDDIMAKGENGGLTKDELIGALRDYPGQISKQTVDPLRADIYEYVGQARRGGVEYDLVVDGVLSDLTLSCEYDLDRKPLLTIESLHVL